MEVTKCLEIVMMELDTLKLWPWWGRKIDDKIAGSVK